MAAFPSPRAATALLGLIAALFGGSVLPAASVTAGSPLLTPYIPPGAEWRASAVAVGTSPPGIAAPQVRTWHRGSHEAVTWVLFDSGHRADDLSSIVQEVKSGPQIGYISNLRTTPEVRCSGRAWWVRWNENAAAPIGTLSHQELVFENHGREALIHYVRSTSTAMDVNVLDSILAYCAKFDTTRQGL